MKMAVEYRTKTLWIDYEGNDGRYRSMIREQQVLVELSNNSGARKATFDQPKDRSRLLRRLHSDLLQLRRVIVLDFFAGSGTTAHAVIGTKCAEMAESSLHSCSDP